MSDSETNRNVLYTILKGKLPEEGEENVKKADAYIDTSLDALELEEPSLYRWLRSDEDFQAVLKSNITAIYSSVFEDSMQGRTFDFTIKNIESLIFRIACTAAWRSAMKERLSISDIYQGE